MPPQMKLRLSMSFTPIDSSITLNLFNSEQQSVESKYQYSPSSFNLIEEVTVDKNQKLRDYVVKSWKVDSSFKDSPVVAGAVENNLLCSKMCETQLEQDEFIIETARKSALKGLATLAPEDLDFGTLSIISNEYKLIPHVTKPFKPSQELLSSEFDIDSILINEKGKNITLKVKVYRISILSDIPKVAILEASSTFLFSGHFIDFQNTFPQKSEHFWSLKMASVSTVATLVSKEWFGGIKKPQVGDTIDFVVRICGKYASELEYSKVIVTGEAFCRGEKIAVLHYDSAGEGNTGADLVLDFLKRHGYRTDSPASLDHAYSFANVEFDLLKGHNLMTMNRIALQEVGKLISYRSELVGESKKISGRVGKMLVKIKHVGMTVDGHLLLEYATVHVESKEVILTGSFSIAQESTAYLFTGQGSQQKDMGMDLYSSSAIAKSIWDEADFYTISEYGFSILNIVRNNPKSLTIHFGGVKGRIIRQNYINLGLFDTSTNFYTFSSNEGLLNATQFTQIALVIMENAAFEDMKSRNLILEDGIYAGHSLGEYSALFCAGIFSLPAIIDTVFYRGMLMQRSVERDAENRSEFGMVAVNPTRVELSEEELKRVVGLLASQSKLLLEIVNFNVATSQYVVAGHLIALEALTNVLNAFKKARINSNSVELEAIIIRACKNASVSHLESFLVLERGAATIPLPGIEIPFHSSHLLSGVGEFRSYLSTKIEPTIDLSILVGRFIPNLVGDSSFEITLSYARKIYDLTNSPILFEALEARLNDGPELGRIILIELLAYQFASPVQWIKTQENLFNEFKVARVIEFGPAPILAGMATATLKLNHSHPADMSSSSTVLSVSSKDDKILAYYQIEDVVEEEEEKIEEISIAVVTESTALVPVVAPIAIDSTTSSIPDVSFDSLFLISAILAQKVKKSFTEISSLKSVKDFSKGRSTLQNEIMGDLEKEFGCEMPYGGEETAIAELSAALSAPSTLGKHSNILVSRLIGSKMPGGFGLSAVKSHLAKSFGLQAGRIACVLLIAVTREPPARLGSEVEALEWLDSVVEVYSQLSDVKISKASSAGGSSGAAGIGTGGMMIDSEQLDKMQAKGDSLLEQQIDLFNRHLGRNGRDGAKLAEAKELENLELRNQLTAISLEQTSLYLDSIQPIFDEKKIRYFDSFSSWAKESVMNLWNSHLRSAKGEDVMEEEEEEEGNENEKLQNIVNRATPHLIKYLDYLLASTQTFELERNFMQNLKVRCIDSLLLPPVFRPFRAKLEPAKKNVAPIMHLEENNLISDFTSTYHKTVKDIISSGITFSGQTALLIMVEIGEERIETEVLKALLSGGARITVGIADYCRKNNEFLQSLYREFGAKSSSLEVTPFNLGSNQDVQSLINYVDEIDVLINFTSIDTNTERLNLNYTNFLSLFQEKKWKFNQLTRPTRVLLLNLPGQDHSCTRILDSFTSDDILQFSRVTIGLTHGHGIARDIQNIKDLKKLGFQTLRPESIALHLIALYHVDMISILFESSTHTVFLNAKILAPNNLLALESMQEDAKQRLINRRITQIDNSSDFRQMHGVAGEALHLTAFVPVKSEFKLDFPDLNQFDPSTRSEELAKLEGLIDLDQVVVMTGYGEVGPWGSSRTRWEAEVKGSKLSLEAFVELAFIMGLIKWFDGSMGSGEYYIGWIDAKTGESLDDIEVKTKFEEFILSHSGIRLLEIEFSGIDAKKRHLIQEIEIQHDLESIEASAEDSVQFKLQHGDKVEVYVEDGKNLVRFKRGAKLFLPKAVDVFPDIGVAAQVPYGWDPAAYGIGEEIVEQVDQITLWGLAAVSEAFLMSGITDPYELYEHVHPSQVGTSIGSAMGGLSSWSQMLLGNEKEKSIQNDIVQETLINSVSGWVNLLLVSSSGPIKNPVGACASGIQSVEIACESILGGKAKVMIAGGVDSSWLESTIGLADMGALSSEKDEREAGREPSEMCRPMTSTRSGMMEGQGCGAQILMSASTALAMGATIFGIVAFTATATDKAGRSLPAPGLGIMNIAKETPEGLAATEILSLDYRQKQLGIRNNQIDDWTEAELRLKKNGTKKELDFIEKEAKRQRKDALGLHGMLRGVDEDISPLRVALGVWGLTVDDINVASMHGTSTIANDGNETFVYQHQFQHLGRAEGNICWMISQKHLTGHAKGAAASFQLNGLAQVLNSSIIPGNYHADNIEADFEEYTYLGFLQQSVKSAELIKCAIFSSFGFGQVAGQALLVHPHYLFAAIEASKYEEYRELTKKRQQLANQKFNQFFTRSNLVLIKDAPPFEDDLEVSILLNPLARASVNRDGSYTFKAEDLVSKVAQELEEEGEINNQTQQLTIVIEQATSKINGVGTDVELVSSIPADSETFLERNFTNEELAYCRNAADFKSSLAGRWCAKEATFKSMKVKSKGAGASLKEIEVLSDENGAPRIVLHGQAELLASEKGIEEFQVSISHSDGVCIAVVVAILK